MTFTHPKAMYLLAFAFVILATSRAGYSQTNPVLVSSPDQGSGDAPSEPHLLGPPGAGDPIGDSSRSQLHLYAENPDSAAIASGDLPSLRGQLEPAGDSERMAVSRRASLSFPAKLIDDQLNFYSPDSLLLMGFGLGTGAVFANTTLDGDIQRHIQSSLQHANSDAWLESLHANKELGDGRYTLPICATAWALGSVLPESEFNNNSKTWGERTIRGFIVGAPPVLLLQRITGGSRPGETETGSGWEPFRDNNGVSGHAFMGALPFITAAKMTDKLGWKVTWYAASTLAPLSRTADGAHYPSQIALGWTMAFLAATAVHSTDNPNSRWRVLPTATPQGSGIAFEYRF